MMSRWLAITMALGTSSACSTVRSEPRLAVRVVDPRGQPVGGVPVELAKVDGAPWDAARSDTARVVATRAADGMADFGPIAALPHDARTTLRRVQLRVLTREALAAAIDLAVPPTKPLEFTLPEGRPLELQLQNHAGEPLVGAARGDLRADFFGEELELRINGGDGLEPVLNSKRESALVAIEFVEGRARVGWVEAGFVAGGAWATLEPEKRRVAGAYWPDFGERLRSAPAGAPPTLEVTAQPEGPMVAGRFIVPEALRDDPAWRDVLQVTRCDAEIELGSGHISITERLRIDVATDGRFAVDLHGRFDDFTELRVHFRDAAGSVVARWTRRIEESERTLPTLELGEVVLRTPRRLASGRVVSTDGSAIVGAAVFGSLHLQELESPTGDKAESVERFRLDERYPARSGADGRFTLYAPFDCRSLQVIASAEGFSEVESADAANARSVDAGARDVTLTLAPCGRIEGRLLLPDPIDDPHARAFVAAAPRFNADGTFSYPLLPTTRYTGEEDVDIAADGTFTLQNVEPGRRTVLVTVWAASGQQMRWFDAVEVQSGATTTLPPLDLRAIEFEALAEERVALRVVDEHHQLLPARFAVVAEDGFRGAIVDGSAGLDLSRHGTRYEVIAPGHRVARVTLDAQGPRERRVELSPGIAVELAVEIAKAASSTSTNAPAASSPELRTEPPPLGSRLVLLPLLDSVPEGAAAVDEEFTVPLDAHGRASLRLHRAGRWRAWLFAPPTPLEHHALWRPIALDPASATFTVAESDGQLHRFTASRPTG
ncbi:MAG: hypothetical protein JNL90_11330 [Planctomycetes bacterium]|nr:hypothetical protein [Planctomycetota bacterium]